MRSNICGNPLIPNTSICTASRVSAISSGSVTGQLAKPSAVAVSSTRLVASPARSRASVLSSLVPNANTAALSSTESVPGGCANAGPANSRAGIGAVGSGCGCIVAPAHRPAMRTAAPRGQLRQVVVIGRVLPNCLRHNRVAMVATARLAAASPRRAPRARPSGRCRRRHAPRAVDVAGRSAAAGSPPPA